jgi:hypothetical protein
LAYRDDINSGDYGSFLDSAFGGTTRAYGLGAAGFDVFGESDILNLQGGGPLPQPDGTDGGILAKISVVLKCRAGAFCPGYSDIPV